MEKNHVRTIALVKLREKIPEGYFSLFKKSAAAQLVVVRLRLCRTSKRCSVTAQCSCSPAFPHMCEGRLPHVCQLRSGMLVTRRAFDRPIRLSQSSFRT